LKIPPCRIFYAFRNITLIAALSNDIIKLAKIIEYKCPKFKQQNSKVEFVAKRNASISEHAQEPQHWWNSERQEPLAEKK